MTTAKPIRRYFLYFKVYTLFYNIRKKGKEHIPFMRREENWLNEQEFYPNHGNLLLFLGEYQPAGIPQKSPGTKIHKVLELLNKVTLIIIASLKSQLS